MGKAAACQVCELHAESTFKIEGMDCHEELVVLERRLGRLAGLEAFSADLVGQRLRVKYDAAKLTTSSIAEAVADTGMRVWLEHEQSTGAPAAATRARQALVVLSGVGLMFGFGLQLTGWPAVWSDALFAAAIVAGGLYTARRAVSAARAFSLDINVLMFVAVAGAVAIGEWSEGATVTVLFALAQLLEARSMDRARRAIRMLMDLTPVDALVRRDTTEQHVSVDEVGVGEIIVVRPGEKVPLDGEVTAGESYVNQAPVTGESLPVLRQTGDALFAGTINGRGALDVRVTRRRRDTTLAHIIHLVERAQAQRAPTQTFVERFARYYTPSVLTLAVAVAVVPPIVFGLPFGDWFYRALVLLVISCPCALVISTPISIVSALAGAARMGVLIKGGAHLERTGAVKCIAFDKTGTVTKGHISVEEVIPADGVSQAGVLSVAAALGARSEHPIARAIMRHAARAGIAITPAQAFQAHPGLGAEALVNGTTAFLGSRRFVEQKCVCPPEIHAMLNALGSRGRTPVLVAADGRMIGVVGVVDETRESARDALLALRELGVERLVLLTGDNAITSHALARELGFDECRAELMPEDKVKAIEELRQRYGTVAMIGDGVNDAPALAAADVGVAMGVAGSDVALETADVALMADELLKIPYAVRLSRAALRNIKTNIALSVGLKAVFLAMAVAGAATLWMAVAADMGASLLVIANGLRLLKAD